MFIRKIKIRIRIFRDVRKNAWHKEKGCDVVTNRIKTVQNPRLIVIACNNGTRVGDIVSDVLNYCKYNTCINDFSQNTDFVIENPDYTGECPRNVIADTILFDDDSKYKCECAKKFRSRVTSYENAMHLYGGEPQDVLTYSSEHYAADVACRNISRRNGKAVFDIIGNGILSRVNIKDGKYSVDEVLACTGVLLAAGLPLASIINYFEN